MIKKTFSVLNKKERKNFYILLFLIILSSFFELLGVGIIYPFLLIILDKDIIKNEFYLEYFGKYDLTYDYLIILSIVFILLVYLVKNIFVLLVKIKIENFSKNFRIRILEDFTYKLFNFPYDKIFQTSTDKILKKLNFSLEFSFTVRNLLTLATEFLTLFLIIIFLLNLNFKISLLLITSFATIAILIYFFTRKKMTYYGKQAHIKYQKFLKEILQSIGGIKEIKIANKESYFYNKVSITNREDSENKFKTSIYLQFPSHLIEVLAVSSVLGIVFIQTKMNYESVIIISILGVYAAALVRLMPSSTRIIAAVQDLKYKSPIADIINKELKDVKNFHKKKTLSINQKKDLKFKKNIKFKNISFSYKPSNKLVLDNLNLTINKGDCIGIFGRSGAGKTTLLNLFIGLLNIKKGSFLVDDKEINQKNIKSWQKKIGLVPQNPFFLNDDIKNNIVFGLDKKINLKKLREVIKQAQLDGLISSLTKGINTQVGERGISLSGGQLQRIAIARALYNNPEILIFDEATNSLDENNEKKIFQLIFKLRKRATIVIISHDKENFKYCDKVFFLGNKKLARYR